MSRHYNGLLGHYNGLVDRYNVILDRHNCLAQDQQTSNPAAEIFWALDLARVINHLYVFYRHLR